VIESLLIANRGEIACRITLFPVLVVAMLALASCGPGGEVARNAAPPAAVAKAEMPAPPTRPDPPAPPSCAPPPTLALSEDFADARHAFAPDTAAFRRLETNFAAAYRIACDHGVLRGRALIPPGAAGHDRLLLKNAPDANTASIYLDGEEGAPASQRHMVLEYPFLTADGATRAPSESDLGEAIFCAVQGASQQEEESSGRCLPD
jgi:hypothetical protein